VHTIPSFNSFVQLVNHTFPSRPTIILHCPLSGIGHLMQLFLE